MIWFIIKNLEEKLSEGNVTEKEAFNYLLITTLIFTIGPSLPQSDKTSQILSLIELVFGVIFTVFLLRSTFQINGNGDRKDYLIRYISISLVSTIRLFVFSFIPILIIVIVARALDSRGVLTYEVIKQPMLLGLSVVSAIIYYFMLTNSFKRVCSVNGTVILEE